MRLAVVASGWHFPLDFYEKIAEQKTPDVDLFCIAHRDPVDDKHVEKLGDSRRERLDKVLYKEIATIEKIQELGWNYKLYPNTIGDWGCSNQWLDEVDYKQYDRFLFTHDDNLILKSDFLSQAYKEGDWMILSNSVGMPKGWLRGSCEFFKKEMMDLLGGKFDLSMTTMTREGKTDTPTGLTALGDWNTTIDPIMKFIRNNKIKIDYLSEYYRVSEYCIEGERGWIHSTHGLNTVHEEAGLDRIFNPH